MQAVRRRIFFFFFQAEDGIRDKLVTGVQTCALPISLRDVARRRPGTHKALLVETIRDLLPPEVLAQEKCTFTLPWESWLRGPLRKRQIGRASCRERV